MEIQTCHRPINPELHRNGNGCIHPYLMGVEAVYIHTIQGNTETRGLRQKAAQHI